MADRLKSAKPELQIMKKKESAADKSHREWMQSFPNLEGLSTRLFNIFSNTGLTKSSIRTLLGTGDYYAYLNSPLRRYRNFGWKSWMELCVWAGLPEPRKPRMKAHKHPCPHCHGRGWVKHYNPLADRT